MNDDLVSRQAAIDALRMDISIIPFAKAREYVREAIETIYNRLEELPSAQPEIIRCRDCKHWICHDRRCRYWNHGVKPLDWCCHAERREYE